MMNNVIIVAGGKGLRMGNELPKQFIAIGRKPVLMHTIEKFYDFDKGIKIIVVIHPDYRDYWRKTCEEYKFQIRHIIVEGGETRFHSVKNGLAFVEDGIVAVHDAARPFTSPELIRRMFELAVTYKAVVPVINTDDSLREICNEAHSRIIDRSKIKRVQTPQVFQVETLKKAYEINFNGSFTDDASVVESIGQEIFLAQGEVTNIKITTPFDLEIAKAIFNTK